jgi:2-polyprenyl-3-methyl-5-hydroxy-6-metoxy-1,4-benzoquinol methylase
LRAHIIHEEDHAWNRRKLTGLYGRVADQQNRAILSCVVGERVLDVGPGYGNLTRAARSVRVSF